MGIGTDLLNRLLIGSLVVVILALLLDEFGDYLRPALQRYQARLMPSSVTWRLFLPLIAALLLALLMWGSVLIQLYLVAIGISLTAYAVKRGRWQQEVLEARQILQLVLAFRSMYQLQPSVFSTLDRVKEKVDQPLKGLVDVLIQSYYLTSSPERAYAELRGRTDNVYLNQFVYILEMSETASSEAVVKALDNLVDRLRTHDELRRDTESSLTSITGQTSVLQRIAAAIVLAVALVPPLRAPYTSTAGQIVFIIFLSAILGGSYYIDRQVGKLVERIS
jgi:hypothetical protein